MRRTRRRAREGNSGGTSVSDAERWLARFLSRFGSPNWTSTTHVCNWHKDTGFSYTFGVEIPLPDVAHSNAFLLWGHNPSSTSLILAHDIVTARKHGMKIVAVDPRQSSLTDAIGPGVVCCQHGWWQECKNLESPGYDASAEGRPIRVCLSA